MAHVGSISRFRGRPPSFPFRLLIALPSRVRGPVEAPPWSLQRPLRYVVRRRQGVPSPLVLAPQVRPAMTRGCGWISLPASLGFVRQKEAPYFSQMARYRIMDAPCLW